MELYVVESVVDYGYVNVVVLIDVVVLIVVVVVGKQHVVVEVSSGPPQLVAIPSSTLQHWQQQQQHHVQLLLSPTQHSFPQQAALPSSCQHQQSPRHSIQASTSTHSSVVPSLASAHTTA